MKFGFSSILKTKEEVSRTAVCGCSYVNENHIYRIVAKKRIYTCRGAQTLFID